MRDDFEGTVVRSRPLSDGGWWASRMDSDGFADAAEFLYFFDGWLASAIREGISAHRREPTAKMGEIPV